MLDSSSHTRARQTTREVGSGLLTLALLVGMLCCSGDSETEEKTAPVQEQIARVVIVGSITGAQLRGADGANRKTFARSKWKERYGDSYIGLVSAAVGPDGIIAVCSANTGVLLVDARDPAQMKALGNVKMDTGAIKVRYPGYHRCQNLVFDGDILYVSHYGDALFPDPFLAPQRWNSPRNPS